jgi:RNA polymerase sigma-70 factor (ECF subfamily)
MTVKEYNKSVDLFSDGVYRFILKNAKNEEVAKDIIQETYTKMWIKIDTISFEKAKSYIFTTAYHTFIDYIRKNKRIVDFENVTENNYSHSDSYSDIGEVLTKGIEQLPEKQRTVLMLRDYEGYSYYEIGEITNLNESQVKVYIYRARLFLKNYIGSIEKII